MKRLKFLSISLIVVGSFTILTGLIVWYFMALPDAGFHPLGFLIHLIVGTIYLIIGLNLSRTQKRWIYYLGVISFPIASISYMTIISSYGVFIIIPSIASLLFFVWLIILKKYFMTKND